MSEEAKLARTVAKRSFTIANKEFNKTVDQNALPVILEKRFDVVSKAWSVVLSKHAEYLAITYPDEDDTPEVEEVWLEKIAEEFRKSEYTMNKLMQPSSPDAKIGLLPSNVTSKIVTTSTSDAIKQSAKLLKLEKMQLDMSINNLHRVLGHQGSTTEVMMEAQKEMKQQLDIYKSAQ